MPTETISEPSPPQATRPIELAPSMLAAPEPTFARGVGSVGAVLAVFGLGIVVATEAYNSPRMISKSWGFITLILGIAALAFHAIREKEIQLRRAYGILGFCFVGLCGLVSLVNHQLFLVYGWGSLLAGLCFLMFFLRHEDDDGWRQVTLYSIAVLGAFFAFAGFLFGAFIPDFILTYGLVLALMGLFYLATFVGQMGSDQGLGYQASRGIGLLGLAAILYAIVWSIARAWMGKEDSFLAPTGIMLIALGCIYGGLSLSLVSDNRFVVLARREIMAYFYSPIVYIVLVASTLVGWISYLIFVTTLAKFEVPEPIVSHYYFSLLVILQFAFGVTAITMRLLSEERRSGTYEVLMCAPVHEIWVVLSKFAASLLFFMLLWIPWGLFLIGLRVELGKPFDYRPLLSFYIALIFTSSAFLAIGLFFSSLTKNQIVAAVLTFGVTLGAIIVMAFLGRTERLEENAIGLPFLSFIDRVSIVRIWRESVNGTVSVRDLVLYASFTTFWLFITVKVLEARKWS